MYYVKQDITTRHSLEDSLFQTGLVLFVAAVMLYLIYERIKGFLPAFPCIFSVFLGLYCPGCGGTRAVEALLHGHPLTALWYHPLVPYSAALYGGFMLSHILQRITGGRVRGWKFHNWYLYVALGIIAVNFLFKNILRLGFGIRME